MPGQILSGRSPARTDAYSYGSECVIENDIVRCHELGPVSHVKSVCLRACLFVSTKDCFADLQMSLDVEFDIVLSIGPRVSQCFLSLPLSQLFRFA